MNWFRIDLGGKTGYLFRLYYNREKELMYAWNKPGKEHFPVANCFLTGGEKNDENWTELQRSVGQHQVYQHTFNERSQRKRETEGIFEDILAENDLNLMEHIIPCI